MRAVFPKNGSRHSDGHAGQAVTEGHNRSQRNGQEPRRSDVHQAGGDFPPLHERPDRSDANSRRSARRAGRTESRFHASDAYHLPSMVRRSTEPMQGWPASAAYSPTKADAIMTLSLECSLKGLNQKGGYSSELGRESARSGEFVYTITEV